MNSWRRLDRRLTALEAASVRLAITVDCAVALAGAAGLAVADESTERVLWAKLYADSEHRAGWFAIRVPTT